MGGGAGAGAGGAFSGAQAGAGTSGLMGVGGGMGGGMGGGGGIMSMLGPMLGGLGGGGGGGDGFANLLQDPRFVMAMNILKHSQGQPGMGRPGFGQILSSSALDTGQMLQEAAQQKARNKMMENMMRLRELQESRSERESQSRQEYMGGQYDLQEKRLRLQERQEGFHERLATEQARRQEAESKANIAYREGATRKMAEPEQMTPYQTENVRMEREKMEETTRRYNEEVLRGEEARKRNAEAQQQLMGQVDSMEGLPDSLKEGYKARITSGVKDPLKGVDKYLATSGAMNPNIEAMDMIEGELKGTKGMFGGNSMTPERTMELLTSLSKVASGLKSEPERLRAGILAKQLMARIPEGKRQGMITGQATQQGSMPGVAPMGGRVQPDPYGGLLGR